MLAADKLQLQSSLKQKATALKEKEFNLHHNNLMTVGTQAALLASLDVTMFIEFQPPSNAEWGEGRHLIPRALKFFYYILINAAFCSNILVVAQTTLLSLLGSSLALRGPDGSVVTATDGLYEERKRVFQAFGVGLACTVCSVVLVVWLMLTPEAAIVSMSVTVFTAMEIYKQYVRVSQRFMFDETETVDFSDLMYIQGPQQVPVSISKKDQNYIRGNNNIPMMNGMQHGQHQHVIYSSVPQDHNNIQLSQIQRSEHLNIQSSTSPRNRNTTSGASVTVI